MLKYTYHDPTIPPLGIYLREMKIYVYGKTYTWMFIVSLFHDTPKLETIQMPINWCTDKKKMMIYNGLVKTKKNGVLIQQHGWISKVSY